MAMLPATFVDREREIKLLTSLMRPEALQGRAIFVFGNTSTGKTTVVRAIVDELTDRGTSAKSAYLNATEVSFQSPKRLYEIVLSKLAGHQLCARNNYSCQFVCDTAAEFCRHLVALGKSTSDTAETDSLLLFEGRPGGGEGGEAADDDGEAREVLNDVATGDAKHDDTVTQRPMYVVIDRAERLRHIDGALNTFLRLPELTGIPVCVVLISTAVWDCLQGINTVPDPFQVHFPNYTKESFQNILLQNPVDFHDIEEHRTSLWAAFVLMLVDNYACVCNDLHELHHLAHSLFPLYCQPVIRGEVLPVNISQLYSAMVPVLKKVFETLYLHESAPGTEASGSLVPSAPKKQKTATEDAGRSSLVGALPVYTKYMLIAGYLASYLPTRLDLRNFTQLDKRNISKNTMAASDSANIEPKPFTSDRLMAVFQAILTNEAVETDVFPDHCLQVSSLVALALFVKVSSEGHLYLVRYKCIAEPALVAAVGDSMKVDVRKYF